MPVYETEFLGDPVPIKKTKKTKNVPLPSPPASIDDTLLEPVLEKTPEPIQPVIEETPKKKRVRKPKAKVEPEIVVPETPKLKRVRKPKAKAKVEPEVIPEKPKRKIEIIEPPQPKKRPKRSVPVKKIIDGNLAEEPPAWFKSYLITEETRRNADKEKRERVPIKEVKRVAEEKANFRWNDGETRTKVNNQVTDHMNKLYSQIHGRKFQ